MPNKCDICGGKIKNGVCSDCGMDYNRTSSADTAYECSEEERKPSDDAEMFSKAMLKGTKTYQHRKKTITIVLLSALLFIIVMCLVLINTSEDAERATDGKTEQSELEEGFRASLNEGDILRLRVYHRTVKEGL